MRAEATPASSSRPGQTSHARADGIAAHIWPTLRARLANQEFGATLTFAGSREGVTRTLPLEIYLQRESDADAAVALSLLLVVVAAVVVIGVGSRALKPGGAGGW